MTAELNGSNAVRDRTPAVQSAGGRALTVVLPVQAKAAGLARRATRAALHSWGLGAVEDTAILLVSELVSNAVIHACGAQLELRLHAGQVRLRIEVHDLDPHPPQVRAPEGLDETGRGLLLVQAISSDWGVRVTHTGKAVWADLALGTQPGPASDKNSPTSPIGR